MAVIVKRQADTYKKSRMLEDDAVRALAGELRACIQQSLRHDPKCPLCKIPATRRNICREEKLDRVSKLFAQLHGAAVFATQAPTQKGSAKALKRCTPGIQVPLASNACDTNGDEYIQLTAAPTPLLNTLPDSESEPSPSRPLTSLRTSPSPAAQQTFGPIAMACQEPLGLSALGGSPVGVAGVQGSGEESPPPKTGRMSSPAEAGARGSMPQSAGTSPIRIDSPEPPSDMPAAEEHAHCTTSMQERSPEEQHGGAVDPPQRRVQEDEQGAVKCALPQLSAPARPCGRRVPSRLQPWTCAACTFENAGSATCCKICDSAKPTAVVQQSGGKMSGATPQQLREAVAGNPRRLRLPRGMGQWTDSNTKASRTPRTARCKGAELIVGRPPLNITSSISPLEAAQASDEAEQRPAACLLSVEDAAAIGIAEAPQDWQQEISAAAGEQTPAMPSTCVSSEAAGTTAAVRTAQLKGAEGPKRQKISLGKPELTAASNDATAQSCDPPPDGGQVPATSGTVQSSSGKFKRPRSKSAQRPARAGPAEGPAAGAKRPRSKSVQRQRVAGGADQERRPDLGRDAPGLARKPAQVEWVCPKRGWRFVSSGLSTEEKSLAQAVAMKAGCKLFTDFTPGTTHIICGQNEDGNAKRTLKFLIGIVSGKWLVGSSWLKACMAEGCLVPEEPHEVMVSDGSGSQSGPLLGRLHVAQGQRLLHGYQVCLQGNFKSEDEWVALIKAAGAHYSKRLPPRPPTVCNGDMQQNTVILMSDDGPKPQPEQVAGWEGATVSKEWLVDTIIAYSIRPLADYVVKQPT